MKLIAHCSSCKESIPVKALMVDNRIELAKQKGETFETRCSKCGYRNSIHVDDVKAVNGTLIKLVGIISIVIAIALTLLFWHYGFIAFVSFSIPALMITTVHQTQSAKIKQFNLLKYNSSRSRK